MGEEQEEQKETVGPALEWEREVPSQQGSLAGCRTYLEESWSSCS